MAIQERNWASLISGEGTTMSRMMEAIASGEVQGIHPALVIYSSLDSEGPKKARIWGVSEDDIVFLSPNQFKDKNGDLDEEAFAAAMLKEFRRRGIDFFTQNGWMVKTPSRVLREVEGYNQHPAPVPEFGGDRIFGVRPHAMRLIFAQLAHEQNPYTQAVAQRVSEQFDKGAVVLSQKVAIPQSVLEMDVLEGAPILRELVLPVEHRVQIDLLNAIASGTVRDQERISNIAAGQEHILFQARRMAIEMFPKA